MNKPLIVITALIFTYSTACAAHKHKEHYYQNKWCNERSGKLEVILNDRTRVDCLTATNAVEFDFGYKWAEAIGQALHYSAKTKKRGGIVLILEKDSDIKFYNRIKFNIKHHKLPIDIWKIK